MTPFASCPGNTALHLAAMNGHADVADLLVKMGADLGVRNGCVCV
jgi:ankyrin repeat protein